MTDPGHPVGGLLALATRRGRIALGPGGVLLDPPVVAGRARWPRVAGP
jgi:hypothetical protein